MEKTLFYPSRFKRPELGLDRAVNEIDPAGLCILAINRERVAAREGSRYRNNENRRLLISIPLL